MTPDMTMPLLENLDLFWLLAACVGGIIGAIVGPNNAFGFTGVMILTGFGIAATTGDSFFFDYVAFGPAFGPHVAFAGAAAASAYSAKKVLLATGRDIDPPLGSLKDPTVLWLAAGFGVAGMVVQRLIALIPWFGSHTDSVALTVFISGCVARLAFGSTGIFHGPTAPEGTHRWLDHQETPGQLGTVAFGAAFMASGVGIVLASYAKANLPETAATAVVNSAQALPFAFSALCIFLLVAGQKVNVTHHITIIAALAAVQFWLATDNAWLALVAGIVFGIMSGFVAEFVIARLTYYYGDTHIDPPAGTIWIMTTLIHIALLAV